MYICVHVCMYVCMFVSSYIHEHMYMYVYTELGGADLPTLSWLCCTPSDMRCVVFICWFFYMFLNIASPVVLDYSWAQFCFHFLWLFFYWFWIPLPCAHRTWAACLTFLKCAGEVLSTRIIEIFKCCRCSWK